MEPSAKPPSSPGWLPEFFILSQRRIRGQMRVLGLSVLVGLVAGLAAVVFYLATQAGFAYTLAYFAGYDAEPHPAGEAAISWLPVASPPLRPWLLVIIPTLGGLAAVPEGECAPAVSSGFWSGGL